jgi:hypothetical protein
MRRRQQAYPLMLLVALSALGVLGVRRSTHAADEAPTTAASCCKAGDVTPPTELVTNVPKGELHNPYPDYAKLAKEEDLVKQFRLPGCNECHGGTGGGGICPALTQGAWFWGNTWPRAPNKEHGGRFEMHNVLDMTVSLPDVWCSTRIKVCDTRA